MGNRVSVTTTLHSRARGHLRRWCARGHRTHGRQRHRWRRDPHEPAQALACARAGRRLPAERGLYVHLTAGATPAQNYDAGLSGHGNVNGFSWGDASVGGPNQFLDNEGYCVSRDDDFNSDPPPVNYYDAGSAAKAASAPRPPRWAAPRPTRSLVRPSTAS